jgi:moderate conductance mechanosensitive channel
VVASLLAPGTSASAAREAVATLTSACGRAPGMACRLTWDITHSSYAADFASAYLAGPVRLALRILLVLVLAALLRTAARRLIGRLTARSASDRARPDRSTRSKRSERSRAALDGRRSQRATAVASVLGNAASVAIFSVAALIILGDLGVNLAPILASAGVLGIALGFGAQSLVQDYLAGIFILLEDQYGVGDVIDVSDVSGTVEAVSLRITRVRDVNGVAWHIRNGTIQLAGNETHGWARAVVDFPVPPGVPVATARAALQRGAADMYAQRRWSRVLLEQPEVWGVETVNADGTLIRVAARTRPLARSEVARELRERLKDALDAAAPPGAAASPDGQAELAAPRAALPAAEPPAPRTVAQPSRQGGPEQTETEQADRGHGVRAAGQAARAAVRRHPSTTEAAGAAGRTRARKPLSRKPAIQRAPAEPSPQVPGAPGDVAANGGEGAAERQADPETGASPAAESAADGGTGGRDAQS